MRDEIHQHQNLLDLAIIIALVVCTFLRLNPAVTSTPFHRDEARWIGNSAILRDWRHPLSDRWQDEGYPVRYGTLDEANRRRSQPPLAMYLIGIGIWLQGAGLPTNGYWIMSQDTDWNIDHGNMPTSEQLTAGRRTNLVVTILTVILIYLIGRKVTNRIGGLVGALIYGMHPLVLVTGVRAWSDPLLVFLIAAATLTAIHFAQRPRWSTSVLLGLLLGLGGATKLSPLVLASGIGILALGLLVASIRRTTIRPLAMRLLVVPIAAWSFFLAAYPYLWTAPIDHTRRLFAFRSDSFDLQASIWTGSAIPTRQEAMRRLVTHLGDQFSTTGALVTWLNRLPGIGLPESLRYLDLVFAATGLILLLLMLRRPVTRLTAGATLVILGGQTALILLSIKVDYARYFLPVLLTVAVFGGVTIGCLWDWMRRWSEASPSTSR